MPPYTEPIHYQLDINRLPNELLFRIIQFLPPHDVMLSAAQVSKRWRQLIVNNLVRVPRIPAHCHVYVMDIDLQPGDDRTDGRSPIMQYHFTTFDTSHPDYRSKRRACLRGNDARLRAIYIQHKRCGMNAEWDSKGGVQKVDSTTVKSLLSFIDIVALRVDVLKRGRRLIARRVDERFAHAVAFCEEMCGTLDPKSLLLCSQNPYFSWCMGELSLQRLSSFRSLDSLVLENMTGAEVFSSIKAALDLRKLKEIRMRLDAKHQNEVENILWVDVQGSLLSSLAEAHVRCLDFSAFSESPAAISAITAEDMCQFIKTWRSLMIPWMIKSILFNSTVTISEFRTVAGRAGLFAAALTDIPYCRFRTYHPSDPNAKLELSCYGNGIATQWCIRSGYLTS
uniref:Cyclin F-box domain containing protein n=1 Tax=Haemonchus contortus TaxID=6289 RepID=W6ND38_HAECO